MILPVAVAMAWYEHELLLGAVAQVHYLHMRSSKNDRKTGPAKTRPAGALATAMHMLVPMLLSKLNFERNPGKGIRIDTWTVQHS